MNSKIIAYYNDPDKGLFTKEATGKWTIEIFKIKEVLDTVPVTYKIEDLKNEDIEGSYYQNELQYVDPKILDHAFRIKDVLKTRTNKKKKEYYVSFVGWPDKFNDWVDKVDDL